jgi:hypothetical protein
MYITCVARNQVYNILGGEAVQFGIYVPTCWGDEHAVTAFRIGNEDSRDAPLKC